MAYKFDTDTNPNQTLYPPVTYPNDPNPRQTYSDVRCLVGGDCVFSGSVDFKGVVTDQNNLVMGVAKNGAVTVFASQDSNVNTVLVGGVPQVLNVDSGTHSKFSNIANLPSLLRGPYEVDINAVSPGVGSMLWSNNYAPGAGVIAVDWSVNLEVVANASNAKLSFYINQAPDPPLHGKCDYVLPGAGGTASVNIKSFGVIQSGGIVNFNIVADQDCTVLIYELQATARMLWQY